MASKITNRETIKDGEGHYVNVAKGKLLLHHVKDCFPGVGSLGWNKVNKYFIWTQSHLDICMKLAEYRETEAVIPMIVSEEPYKIGDNVFYPSTNQILLNVHGLIKGIGATKLIALPQNLSLKFLEEIVNHRLVNHDEVFVEVEMKSSHPISNESIAEVHAIHALDYEKAYTEKLAELGGPNRYYISVLDSSNYVNYFIGERDIATAYAIWCWGKQIPTETEEIKHFFNRFLRETGRNK